MTGLRHDFTEVGEWSELIANNGIVNQKALFA
jgi:hypothetical protein